MKEEMKHGMTDQGNKAAVAHKKKDGLLPTKAAFKGTDGSGFSGDHMDEAMTDGGKSGPERGPVVGAKRMATAEMSQAIRKKMKASAFP